MISFRRPVLALALLLALAAPALAAPAANRFDGAWSVVAIAETGTCTGPLWALVGALSIALAGLGWWSWTRPPPPCRKYPECARPPPR